MKSKLIALTAVGVLAREAGAASFALIGTASSTSQYTDYFSNAYATIGNEPDGMYDITTNAAYSSYNVFPFETLFNIGALGYDDAGLTGVGAEIAPVVSLTMNVNQNVDINWGTYLTTISGLSGTVSLLNGEFAGAHLTSGVSFTLTSGPAAGLSYTGGTFSITANDFALLVEDTPVAFPLHLGWNVSGTGVSAVPEPSGAVLLLSALGGLALRRRRK